MIEVLFFARIREALEVERLSVPLVHDHMTLAMLRQQLIDSHGGQWGEVLGADNVVKSVNQQVVGDDHMLADGDEVAFFPPVTGG